MPILEALHEETAQEQVHFLKAGLLLKANYLPTKIPLDKLSAYKLSMLETFLE